ncbi:MAG: SDR family oxidoreductase [bacterium]|nr:SDR family oxidoreductase [bacterium]
MSKRIFITGGASGLGLAIARRYAADGWRVCIADVNDERGQDALATLKPYAADSLYLHVDVTREEDLQAAADELQNRWGGVDVVVNNAGVAQAGAIEDVPLADWLWIIDINLLGVVRGCKVFTPVFKRQGQGYFVNVASMAGLLSPPMMSSYNATKAAVVALSETLQVELADSHIGVSVVCPSFFQTNLADSMRSSDPRLQQMTRKLLKKGGLSADAVAASVFDSVHRQQFYILPHADAGRIWMFKRYSPRTAYAWLLKRSTRGMQKPAR